MAALAVLVAWNLVANLVAPDALEIPVSLVGAASLVLLARRAGVFPGGMGFRSSTLGSGLRVGGLAAGIVIALVAMIGAIPASRELFADARFAGIGGAETAYDSLVRIPLGTALGEEIAFRGALLGMFLLWMSPLRATLLSSLLFGLWHVLPAVEALETTAVDLGENAVVDVASVIAQVVVTAVAGVLFSWLRFRGRNIVAPVVAHWALNGSALVAGWLIIRNGWA